MYVRKVPTFVRKVDLTIPFPKLQPKHEFINIGRTTNMRSHQYKKMKMDYRLGDMVGEIKGEFLRATNTPNGRCVFTS